MHPHGLLALVVLALTPLARAAPQQPTAPAPAPPAPSPFAVPAANPADVVSIDAILKAVYNVISGPAGRPRDWNRMRSLFIRGARLIPAVPRQDRSSGLRVLDVEGYIQSAGPYFEKNGFFEREAARRLERFGNIAHAFSTYESRHAAEDSKPFARGINSIQLVRDEGRWWIVTIFWDAERPDNPLPPQYLPRR